MKPWKTAIICFVIGLITGSLSSFFVVRHMTNQFFEDQYVIQCYDYLNVLFHLKSGKEQALLEHMESQLPLFMSGVPNIVHDQEKINSILWQAQRYYEENALDVPDSLQPLFDKLPPRPPSACKIPAD